MNTGFARGAAAAVCAIGALWVGAAQAETACLNDDGRKVCMDLTSLPSQQVQPSTLSGTDTFVHYTATLRIDGNKSSRFVQSTFQLSDSYFVSFEAPADLTCSLAGPMITCFADKLEPGKPATLTAIARSPTTEGPFTNTAVFGWNGRTATVAKTVLVKDTAGESWVNPGEEVTLVTDDPGNPDEQVTADNPLYGEVTIPAQPHGYYARLAIVRSSALVCTGGLFLSTTDGGPYVCRQPGDPNRWIELQASSLPVGTVFKFRFLWDASIVPATQLPPSPIAPTGVPEFAVFYAYLPTPPPAVASAHAFANTCGASPVPPCLEAVTRFDTTQDWQATGYFPIGDGVAVNDSPLAPLYAALDWLLNPVDAEGIKPPIGFM